VLSTGALSGSSTPLTVVRVTLIVALAYTTLAMLNPALPPIWNKSLELKSGATPAVARPVANPPACFQFSGLAPTVTTLVAFFLIDRLVAINCTALTPCNCALPSDACNPV
jgi:hypothetical protein